MYKSKLNNLVLVGSVDTISIVSPEFSATPPNHKEGPLKGMRIANSRGDGITRFRYFINPNNTNAGEVFTYTAFIHAMNGILAEMGISEYEWSRVDFRVDSYQDNYDELAKLNKCIILLLSMRYSVNNRYQSIDPLTLEKLTIRIQNTRLEAENYNKGLQEPHGDVENRLELRSKSIPTDKDIPHLIRQWAGRLDCAIRNYQQLQDRCNSELVKRWRIEKRSSVKTFSEFIRRYNDNIFTRKQLIALYKAVGAQNPVRAADNFKQRNCIEFFSQNDLKSYVNMVNMSLEKFMLNV